VYFQIEHHSEMIIVLAFISQLLGMDKFTYIFSAHESELHIFNM
jgi:hypothetical protein